MNDIFTEKITVPAGRPARCLLLHTILANAGNAAGCAAKLETLLHRTEPDFVLLNGDITEKQNDAAALEALLTVLLEPITKRSLPWAHTFGDKDRIDALDGEKQLAVYRKFPGCLTISGAADLPGCGNYVIPLYRENESDPVFFLWMMDTHDHVQKYERDYGSVTRARLASPLYTEYYNDGIRFRQTMWYHHTSLILEEKYGRRIPGILCFHIPTPEHVLITMNQQHTCMEGEQWEAVSCQTVNGGIFSAVFERRDVCGIYCGNSRRNHFSGRYGGITLAQTRSFQWSDGGGALVEIDPDNEIKCKLEF